MSIFKCKMCGGALEIHDNETVAVCEYCGTKQTLPKLDSDKRMNLYDRADYFRRNNEFDKAMNLYEQILSGDNTDAEAYWSIVLCRYGIEYVEDPKSHKHIPTVNRTQYTSIYSDADYQSALKYADDAQRAVYEEEAKAIDDIQKGILEISAKEEPFDVFICYKETDSRGRRTPDSVLAGDLYHELVKEGFKVFFSHITLEDKLGVAYEPYIFAALNSAKVMVVIGTKPEHFNAVWVKNEWSRYLTLIKNGAKKTLIPAYRDMNPYDLPEEFAHLQAQDMSKLGFMQDLIRGIKKIAQVDETKAAIRETVVISNGNVNISPLLRRVFIFLEDENWQEADEYCERVLDQEPENAQAYLGKLMAELCVRKQEDLANCNRPFDNSNNYRKILRFGDDKLITELKGDIDYINERNENTRKETIYNKAVNKMNNAMTESQFISASAKFKVISGFKDADELAAKCIEKAEIARKDEIYSQAKAKMADANTKSDCLGAINLFNKIPGWRDVDRQISICHTMIEKIKERERLERERRERDRQIQYERWMKAHIAAEESKRRVKIIITAAIPVIVIAVLIFIWLSVAILPDKQYDYAVELYNSGEYDEALALFESLERIKDSKELIQHCKYNLVIEKYGRETFDKMCSSNIGDTFILGSYEQDNNLSNGKEPIEWIILDKNDKSFLLMSKQVLDCHEFDTNTSKETRMTWYNSSIRRWLNNKFYNDAFCTEEKYMIKNTEIEKEDFDSYPKQSMDDMIFLLSVSEVEKLVSSEERACKATQYAIDKGTLVNNEKNSIEENNAWWWLRTCSSSGLYNNNNIAGVSIFGSVHETGKSCDFAKGGVRPALWIDLDIESY